MILDFLWIFSRRDRPDDSNPDRISNDARSLLNSLRYVMKIREVWLIALITLAAAGLPLFALLKKER